MHRRRAALLLLGAISAKALSAAGGASTPYPMFQWPVLHAIEGALSRDVVRSSGVPVQVSAIRVQDEPDAVLAVYLRAFRAAHLFVLPDRDQPQYARLPMVTALDPVRRISYTVMFQFNRDHTLTVLQGEAHLKELQTLREGVTVPLFPGARAEVRSYDETSEVVSYEAVATEAEVQGFYAKVLGEAGYSLDERDAGLYRRRGEQMRLLAQRRGKGMLSVVVVHRVGGEARTP